MIFFRCVSLAVKKQTNQRLKFSLKNTYTKIKRLNNVQPKYSADTKRRRVATGDSLRRHGKVSIDRHHNNDIFISRRQTSI